MDEVAQRYGFSPNRSGFIQCPFHKGDNHGSLKLYPGQKGWHCFGCQRGGSVIDFVMQLYGIDFRQACLRLNTDFGLRLTGQRPDQVAQAAAMEKRRMEQERRRRLETEYRGLAAEHCYWWQIQTFFKPAVETGFIHPLYAKAVKKLPWLEYRLDLLEAQLARR